MLTILFLSVVIATCRSAIFSTSTVQIIRNDPLLDETHNTSIAITINNITNEVLIYLYKYSPDIVWAGFGFEYLPYNPLNDHNQTYSIILDYDNTLNDSLTVKEYTLSFRGRGTRYNNPEINVLSDIAINGHRDVILQRSINGSLFSFPSSLDPISNKFSMTVISAISNRFSLYETSLRHQGNQDDRNHSDNPPISVHV